MTMPISEKNFLERLAGYVPGLSGYRDREARRETDRRLREFLASRLDEGRAGLNEARLAATKTGDMASLEVLGRLDRMLQKTAASLRYADHGYSGVFDQLKIREAELDAIYAYDTALIVEVVGLADRLRGATAADLDETVRLAAALETKVARRREVLDKPAGA